MKYELYKSASRRICAYKAFSVSLAPRRGFPFSVPNHKKATSVVGEPGRTVSQGGIPKNKYQRSTLSQKDRENSK